jgi:hypothetical protein
MGLLTALNLPRPQHWPAAAPAKTQAAAPRLARVASQGEPVAAGGPSPENDADEPTRIVRPARTSTEAPMAANEPTTPVAASSADEADEPAPLAAEIEAGGDVDAEPVAGSAAASSKPTTNEEIGYGDFSLGLKESADGASLIIKWEHKQNVAAQNFKVWVIPCYVKADLKIGIEGEIVIKGQGDRQVGVKAGGALELGVGGTSDSVTAGPYGEVALVASTKVPTRLSEAREVAMNPFVVDIHGTGKVGIKFELKDSWTRNSDCELVNWHLFIVHVGAYANGRFGPIRVEPGKDMQRLIAALQQVGPAIADAVEKYAPEKVKQVAEDGAKWVAESEEAKDISDATEVVLDKVKEKTGADIGAGAEKVVQFLVDPGGETSQETNERIKRENEEFNASHGEFQEVMAKSGLQTEFNSTLYRTAEDYNRIVDTFHAGGDWRPMVAAWSRSAGPRKRPTCASRPRRSGARRRRPRPRRPPSWPAGSRKARRR